MARGEAQYPAGIQASGLGRGELVGDQDGIVRQFRYTFLDTQYHPEHPLADIHQVQGALDEQVIAEQPEQVRRFIGGGTPGKRRALALCQQ